ncbi:MAG: ferrochelatase [Armatimonadota bacterium]|nr:ferrochelatase [Armatimonadota bacterium]MDR7587274.1 ferrochelatase [Armatimonadota bacterium]MDR7611142.1 ferrochelatase [Armatimonadota bacterium]
MTGLLLMAYGTPRSLDDVEAYLAHIRGGRRPSAEQVRHLQDRYRRIGGRSPLDEITRRQADGVAALLRARGWPVRPYVGYKHASPFIADAVAQMAAQGVRRAVGLVLAPQYSRLSVGVYLEEAAAAAGRAGIALRGIPDWHDHPGFVAAVAARVGEARRDLPQAPVVFTAHSLPARILSWNDPYPEQLARTCALVAEQAGVEEWTLAYQSASPTGEEWMGPDLLDVLRSLHAAGRRTVVVCPVGFVADHLEILYDIDVEAARVAAELGLRLVRTRSPNADPDFLAALADIVGAWLEEGDR